MPTLTINLTNEQAQRIQEAFATPSNPNPGMAELKEFCINRIRAYVHEVERRKATEAITVEPIDPT